MPGKFVDLFLIPQVWTFLGAATAFPVAALGSSRGCGIAGQAAAGVVAEDPSKFGRCMVLQALPSTQAMYGFVIAFFILGKLSDSLTLQQGLSLFATGLPAGIVGYVSALFQGKVATAGIHLIAKRPENLVSAIIFSLMVELFAILAFVISILMIGRI